MHSFVVRLDGVRSLVSYFVRRDADMGQVFIDCMGDH